MGPSRKLHFGFPALSALRFSKMPLSSQNLRMERSSDGKSTEVSTFSNGMTIAPFAADHNSLLYQLTPRRTDRFRAAGASSRRRNSMIRVLGTKLIAAVA